MMKILLNLSLFLLVYFANGQSESLELISKEEPLLETAGAVTEVTVIYEKEKSITIRLHYEGFQEEDFMVKGEILDNSRRPIPVISPQEQGIPSHSGQTDLIFAWRAGNLGKQPVLKYLKISIRKKTTGWSILDLATAKYVYLYRLERETRPDQLVKIYFSPKASSRTIREPLRGLVKSRLQQTPLNQTDTLDENRQGPANIPYQFWPQLESEHNFAADQQPINIFGEIYRDANPHSGYFYYLPAGYHLNWSEEKGHALYINYLKNDGTGPGEVAVTAELKPNISKADLEIAKSLLLIDLANDPVPVFRELVSLPLAAPPEISLLQLTNFGVKPEDIHIQVPSDFLNPIVVSWKMKHVEDLQSALVNSLGLNGNIRMQGGGDMPEKVLPLQVRLDDHRTFGAFELRPGRWRRSPWFNPTPLPVVLKNFHVLILEPESGRNVPRIYTWNLGDQSISPRDTVQFQAQQVPSWIDRHPNVRKMWIEYTVNPCDYCELFNIPPPPSDNLRPIEFTVMDPLSFTGAKLMKIRVRSHQVGNSAHGKTELPPLTVNADGVVINGGHLLVADGQQPEFEYLIEFFMEDGASLKAPYWQSSSELDVPIGSYQIKRLFPRFLE